MSWKSARVLILLFVSICSCSLVDNDDEHPSNKNGHINPKLHRLLYWGEVDALNWGPNVGRPVADLRFPIWVSEKRICLFSRTKSDGSTTRGIFEIKIDPATLEFVEHEVFEFDSTVVLLAYHSGRDQLIIGFGNESGELEAKYATLDDGRVILHGDVIPAGWNPFGIYVAVGTQEVYFYGRNPSNHVAGFYRRDGVGAALIHQIDLSPLDARGASISMDGETLFFGVTNGYMYTATTQLFSLATDGQVALLGERNGEFVDVAAHPSEPQLLLLNYQYWGGDLGFENHVELIELGDPLAVTELDVDTHPDSPLFATAEWLKWSPGGQCFVFSAGAFSGEGGGGPPLEVWTYSLE